MTIPPNPWAPIPDDVLRTLQRLGLTPDSLEAEVRRLREFKQRVEDDLNAAGVSFGMVARTVEEREAEILRLEETALALARTVKDHGAALERAHASESIEVRRSAEARRDRDYWHQRATDLEMGASA